MSGLLRQRLKANRGVDQIAQDEPRDMRFAIKESGRRLIKHGLGEASGAIAARRWSEAEPEGGNGGVAVSGAGGRYPSELWGRTVL
ncbi:hypothetical protein WG907_00665 [Sphingobium sp. AN558]|uniref:hypothetical protein n=1 Tax=Sphingobium sp. AN558 TaxID=3133442 RepID=UPI0030C439EA